MLVKIKRKTYDVRQLTGNNGIEQPLFGIAQVRTSIIKAPYVCMWTKPECRSSKWEDAKTVVTEKEMKERYGITL